MSTVFYQREKERLKQRLMGRNHRLTAGSESKLTLNIRVILIYILNIYVPLKMS